MKPLEILHHQSNCILVCKPAGLPTQAPGEHASLQSLLREQQRLASTDYLTPVHRLDRVVSGVVLFATTKKAARLLSEQFEHRVVAKTYVAIVDGLPFDSTCPGILNKWIDWIAKVPDQPRAQIVANDTEGAKQAVTKAELVWHDDVRNRSLVRMRPETGRMHQLRLQLAHRGSPIVDDIRYGGTSEHSLVSEPTMTHQEPPIALHAESLSFRDPTTSKWITVHASPPEWVQSTPSGN